MNRQSLLDLHASSDIDTFERRLVGIAGSMDFGLVSAAVAVDRPGLTPIFEMIGNTPAEFLAASRDPNQVKRDPVIRDMRRLSLPFTYDRRTYIDAGADDLWEDQAAFGYHTGIAVALHQQAGRHFLIGLDRDLELPAAESDLMRLLADLQLLAVYAQDAAMRLFFEKDLGEKPSLSPREKEVLVWAAQGKTAAETARILGLTPWGVEFHIRNANRKLSAPNKHAAVARATYLGIL